MSDAGQKPECSKSEREDKKHSWHFDGDDPYVICYYCGKRQDAISGKPIETRTTHPVEVTDKSVGSPLDGELQNAILNVINRADEISRATTGLADDKYIAHQEALVSGIEQLFTSYSKPHESVKIKTDEELRAQIEYMFASAWQDGVHHLNPKYLRRDTTFTDKAMQLFAAHLQAAVRETRTEELKKSLSLPFDREERRQLIERRLQQLKQANETKEEK